MFKKIIEKRKPKGLFMLAIVMTSSKWQNANQSNIKKINF